MAFLSTAGARATSHRIWSAGWLALAALGGAGSALTAQAVRASEYQVKAVFLFNFAQFVDWPAAAFSDSASSLVICILGDDPFGGFLDQTVRNEHVGGRALTIRRYQNVSEIATCHILFISRAAVEGPEEILSGLKHRPILTVSDGDRFAERGGMIRFVTDRNRIRIQINLSAADAAHLTISSKLLRLAEIVTPPRP